MKAAAAAVVTCLIAPLQVSAQENGPLARALARESIRLARTTPAQPPHPGWERVRAIDRDVHVVVDTRDQGVVSGTFLAADTVSITIDCVDRITQIPIDRVVEVKTVERHVARGIGIGAAIAGSVAFGLIVANGGGGDEYGFYKAVSVAPLITGAGIGIGAAVGAPLTTDVVYRAPTSGRPPGTAAGCP